MSKTIKIGININKYGKNCSLYVNVKWTIISTFLYVFATCIPSTYAKQRLSGVDMESSFHLLNVTINGQQPEAFASWELTQKNPDFEDWSSLNIQSGSDVCFHNVERKICKKTKKGKSVEYTILFKSVRHKIRIKT